MSTAAPLQTVAATPKPAAASSRAGLLLQRCACGSPTASLTGECEECRKKKHLQARLTVGAVNDPLEREAETIAGQVLSAPRTSRLSAAPVRVQRVTTNPDATARAVPTSVDRVLASPGRPLEPALRQDMEQRFGHDFSQVRVHTDSGAERSAVEVGASAYTVGHDVVFRAGSLAPGTALGRHLIAHELAHVLQQREGRQLQRWASCKPARLSLQECPPREPGELQRADSGQMVFLPSLKLPITGEQGVLIANFNVGRASIKRNLHDSIYWNQFLKKIAINGSLWGLWGFTDCQGKEGDNETLRKERAAAVFDILPAPVKAKVVFHRAAPISQCVTENNTAADRTLNRAVAFVLEGRNVDFKPEEVPPNFVCGPNVTDSLGRAVADLKSKFDGLSDDEQEDVCGTLNSLLYGAWTWDVPALYHENNSWIVERYRPDGCATKGGAPACGETVQVGDQCYYSGTANYVVFGVMCRLCQQNLDEDEASDYDEDHMLELIDFYKGPGVFAAASGNWRVSRRWAQAGYHGWPSGGTPPAGDRPNCLPRCPVKYWSEPLKARWCPHIDPYDQCYFWSRRRSSRRFSPGRL